MIFWASCAEAPHELDRPWDKGGLETGCYRNVFAELGYDEADIEARVQAVFALVWGHGVNHCFDALEGILVNVNVLDLLAEAWNHCCQFLDVTHLFHLLNLSIEVVVVELVLGNLLLQTLLLLMTATT